MSDNEQIEQKQIDIILSLLKSCLDLSGDVVEFGCYAGGTSIKMAKILGNKKLWLYDSFEGLPEKSNCDFSSVGEAFKAGELKVSKSTVMKKFLHSNLPRPIIKKAWFDELDSTKDLPDEIAFALLDGDYYESIKTSLKLVVPKMNENGIIVVHDYQNEALPGAARAVDDFMCNNKHWRLKIQQGLAILSKISP